MLHLQQVQALQWQQYVKEQLLLQWEVLLEEVLQLEYGLVELAHGQTQTTLPMQLTWLDLPKMVLLHLL
jgi:hypothetical protein